MERLVSDVGEYLPRDGQDYDSNASNTVGDSDSMSRQSSFEQQDMSGSRSVSLARQQLSFGMTEYQHSQHQTLLDRWEPAVDVRSMQMRGDVPCPEPTIRQPSFCYGVTLQPAFQPLTQRQSFVNKNPQVYTNTSQTMYSESVVTSASQVTYQGAEQTLSSHIIKNPNVLNYSNMGDSALPSDQKSFEANLRESNGKFCGVCGDVARSYHFGGLSCDSCKAFFRRSVQNDNYMRFQCYHTGQCVLSVNNRKSCQYCRMRRCFEIGMEKSWVMTEEERKALMKIRSEKKLTKQLATAKCITVPVSVSSSEKKTVEKSSASSSSSSSSPSSLIKPDANDYVPLIERMTDYLSLLEIKETESIVTKYAHAYQQVPYRSELRNFDNARPGFQSMEVNSQRPKHLYKS